MPVGEHGYEGPKHGYEVAHLPGHLRVLLTAKVVT
jgi:hypothetical protein